jgi:hypothetical protein
MKTVHTGMVGVAMIACVVVLAGCGSTADVETDAGVRPDGGHAAHDASDASAEIPDAGRADADAEDVDAQVTLPDAGEVADAARDDGGIELEDDGGADPEVDAGIDLDEDGGGGPPFCDPGTTFACGGASCTVRQLCTVDELGGTCWDMGANACTPCSTQWAYLPASAQCLDGTRAFEGNSAVGCTLRCER